MIGTFEITKGMEFTLAKHPVVRSAHLSDVLLKTCFSLRVEGLYEVRTLFNEPVVLMEPFTIRFPDFWRVPSMYRLKVILSDTSPVFVEEEEIKKSLREWFLNHVLEYTDQCMSCAKILLSLSVAGIAAVSYVAGQLSPDPSLFQVAVPQIAFGLCILLSSATFFPIGLTVSASEDVGQTLKTIVWRDYLSLAAALVFFLVGLGLTVVLFHG